MLLLELTAAILWALSVAVAAYGLIGLHSRTIPHDTTRRGRLRDADRFYATWEGVIDRLAPRFSSDSVDTNLRLAAEPLPWTGVEYESRAVLQGGLWALVLVVPAAIQFGWFSVVLATVVALWYPRAILKSLAQRARDRLARIRRRLPFAMDLIASQLAAGASLHDSIRSAADELHDQPIGEELATIARGVDGGLSLARVVRESVILQADADLAAVAAEIARADDDGVAAARSFRAIARQLRLRAVQWAEQSAAEAQTRMSGPVMLAAVSCMILLVAPFVLEAIRAGEQ
jgi:Flp pilus assembly protein TadB